VEVDVDWAVVATLDLRLDIAGFDPRQEGWGGEDIVDSSTVVAVSCGYLRIPTCET